MEQKHNNEPQPIETTSAAIAANPVLAAVDLNDLCNEYAKEGVTGAISFRSPFYKLICQHLGIKYKDLGRIGKMKLKADAIDTYNMRSGDAFHDGSYYVSQQ